MATSTKVIFGGNATVTTMVTGAIATASTPLGTSISTPPPPPLRVAIIGGSIGGLAAATAFHRLGASVSVFEKSGTPFEGRGGSIGFCAVDMWQNLTGRRMIRRGKQASRSQGAFLYGDLWAYLAVGLPESVVRYGENITDLGEDAMRPTVKGEHFDLAVVADGAWSQLRTRYFGPDVPTYAGWQAWRFRVPLAEVPGWDSEGERRVEHYATILMKIAKDDGSDWIMGGTSIACPESEIKKPEMGANRQAGGLEVDDATPSWFLDFYREKFGHVEGGEICRAMEAAAKYGKITPNAQYEFAASSVVQGRIVLVGDAAHTAVPRTAMGAHTAILDGLGLLEAFHPLLTSTPNTPADWCAIVDMGLAKYGPLGLKRARELYFRSVEASKPVLPPGWSRDDSIIPLRASRVKSLSVAQLKAELLARRAKVAGLVEKADLVQALLVAAGLSSVTI
jgi:2-polyprenyl-6-methoxyphenol hydroxylase-like FAD-dependent oxidoreductase